MAARIHWRRIRRFLPVAIAAGAAAFIGVAWLAGEMVLAPANHAVGPPPDDLPARTLTIPSTSGNSLSAWDIPSDGATATVLLLHPIRGDRRSMLGRARLLHDAGYATFLVDLQAHGESPGTHITAGYRERLDVAAAVDFIRSRNPDHKIGVIGWSLGGAATLLASPLPIDALVLESVYPTLAEAVHNRISMRLGPLHHVLAPALLVQLHPRLGISAAQLRPIDKIDEVQCPTLIASGDLDRHTTLDETRRLYDAAPAPKRLTIFAGADHTDLMVYDPEQYCREIIPFLDAHLRAGQMVRHAQE